MTSFKAGNLSDSDVRVFLRLVVTGGAELSFPENVAMLGRMERAGLVSLRHVTRRVECGRSEYEATIARPTKEGLAVAAILLMAK